MILTQQTNLSQMQEGNLVQKRGASEVTTKISQEICKCISNLHPASRSGQAILHKCSGRPTKGTSCLVMLYLKVVSPINKQIKQWNTIHNQQPCTTPHKQVKCLPSQCMCHVCMCGQVVYLCTQVHA